MKKMLGVAAAALLLSAGAVSASTVTIGVTLNGTTYSCPLNVTLGSDPADGISGNILIGASSSACAFYGSGVISKAAIDKKHGGPNVATIAGYSSEAAYFGYHGLEVFLQLTDGGFVDKNKYEVYAITDGNSAPVFIHAGKYGYQP